MPLPLHLVRLLGSKFVFVPITGAVALGGGAFYATYRISRGTVGSTLGVEFEQANVVRTLGMLMHSFVTIGLFAESLQIACVLSLGAYSSMSLHCSP